MPMYDSKGDGVGMVLEVTWCGGDWGIAILGQMDDKALIGKNSGLRVFDVDVDVAVIMY
jgi:hypothetical protein